MGLSAFGTLLQMGDGGTPENFTTIAEVVEITGPRYTVDTVDTTSHSSPGGYEEIVTTIRRSGEVTFSINYLPTNATHNATTGLLAALDGVVETNFQLVFPDDANTTWEFSAYVTGFEPAAPHDGKLSASVTLKPTGQPVLA